MKLNGRPRTDFLTADTVTPFVRQLLADALARVTSCSYQLIKGEALPPNRGIFRLSGIAASSDSGEKPWAMYLKIVSSANRSRSSSDIDPTHREALFYQSDFARTMTGGVIVPRCLGVLELEDDAPWIFLEEAVGTSGRSWTKDRFGVAARHLGQFQGEFLCARELPLRWTDRRHWVVQHFDNLPDRVKAVERIREHPLTIDRYGGELGAKIKASPADHRKYLDAAMRLPTTVVHGDLNRSDLIAPSDESQTRTVLIDWDFWGIDQIGVDTCTLMGTSAIFDAYPEGPLPEIMESIYYNFLAGVRDAGWRGDSDIIRFAVVGLPVLIFGLGPPPTVERIIDDELRPGMEREWGSPRRKSSII